MDDAIAIGTKIRARFRHQQQEKSVDDANALIPHEVIVDDETCYKVGDRVEARFRGRGRRWYKGIISGMHENQFDIDYDDGDRDRRLSLEFIRRLPSKPSQPIVEHEPAIDIHETNNAIRAFTVGQKVEARYRGRGRRWYKGTIVGQENGAYDIDYDDGDKDRSLSTEHIQAIQDAGHPKLEMNQLQHTTPPAPPPKPNEIHITVAKPSHYDIHNHIDEISDSTSSSTKPRASSSSSCPSSADTDGHSSMIMIVDNRTENDTDRSAAEIPKLKVRTDTPSNPTQDEDEDNKPSKYVSNDIIPETTTKVTTSGNSNIRLSSHTVQQQSKPFISGRGNRVYSGVVSNVKVSYSYEITYRDGAKDMHIPFGALCVEDNISASDIHVGDSVNVLSWQDRFNISE